MCQIVKKKPGGGEGFVRAAGKCLPLRPNWVTRGKNSLLEEQKNKTATPQAKHTDKKGLRGGWQR
jgi:hypothetical protein